jgi:hypothetical protein
LNGISPGQSIGSRRSLMGKHSQRGRENPPKPDVSPVRLRRDPLRKPISNFPNGKIGGTSHAFWFEFYRSGRIGLQSWGNRKYIPAR